MNSNITILTIKNSRWIRQWMRQFCNATMRQTANLRKTKGARVGWILQVLLALPFCQLSIWRFCGAAGQAPGRDTFYRFLSNARYNWRSLLLQVSGALIGQLHRLTGPKTDRVLVLDDSPYKRSRSKAVEYLGRQYDHSTGQYYRGFRMLTLGWSDGHSFVPTQMELPANAVSDKRIGPDPTLDGRTHAGKRAGQACRKATEVALEMVERSGQQQVPADYVTFDSWFAQPGLLARISEQLPVVCMLKNHPNVLYRQGKRIYTLERLYHKVASRTRSNPEGPIIGSITVQMLSGPNLRVVFVRDQQDPDQWGALASSDLQITPQHICRIYAKRWAIEVFFKQTKQQLGLDSELQVRSYTACVAFTSIVFIRYMMLSFYQRQCTDNRTIPGLFYAGCEQLQAITLQCCLQIVLTEILRALFQSLPAEGFKTACAISGVIEHFAQNLVANSMTFKPLTCTCES